MPDYVKITIDGTEIPIKDFVQDIIGQGIEGMIKTLNMVPSQYKELKVVINPASRPKK
ncbi:MAG: hypothetical protein RBG13Loki_3354 [Promethearchaeota archaeon CR_4]|nr:MAG: hypothetical protein RBG13Loki_3354 [Candidatus Lokiarchaeota archaeon CR_4]